MRTTRRGEEVVAAAAAVAAVAAVLTRVRRHLAFSTLHTWSQDGAACAFYVCMTNVYVQREGPSEGSEKDASVRGRM